ncbi:MAG TPA: SseB family protein [Polyangiaceae bacterium]|nr:SseB family protein [Polyangiaceae bacterium]
MPSFEPENSLEQVLVAAATERDARATFYRVLLSAPLFVLEETDGGDPTEEPSGGVLEVGSTLRIRHVELDGIQHVPVFSSMTRLLATIREPQRYVSLIGRDLFEIVRGSPVILNFGAEYGKQFLPSEIEAMLDGSIFDELAKKGPPSSGRRKRFGIF